MFNKILMANRGAERPLAAANPPQPARAARGTLLSDLAAERRMFDKILIANCGDERPLAAAIPSSPARVARGNLAAE